MEQLSGSNVGCFLYLLSLWYSVILLVSFTSSAYAKSTCHRWNCPCDSQTFKRNQYTVSKRFQSLSQKALLARRQTEQLMQRMKSERFRDNESHIASLHACADSRDTSCLKFHLTTNCGLQGLPESSILRNERQGTNELIRDVRGMLTALAVFVDHARQQEEFNTDPRRSLSKDIWHIQEDGLYQMLCSLEAEYGHLAETWIPKLSSSHMESSCRNIEDRAPVDNRNYMVFYTLHRILQDLSKHIHKLRKRFIVSSDDPDHRKQYLDLLARGDMMVMKRDQEIMDQQGEANEVEEDDDNDNSDDMINDYDEHYMENQNDDNDDDMRATKHQNDKERMNTNHPRNIFKFLKVYDIYPKSEFNPVYFDPNSRHFRSRDMAEEPIFDFNENYDSKANENDDNFVQTDYMI